MNRYRRAEILKVLHKLEDIKTELSEIQGEEQDCYDNMPENLQMSERAEQMQDALYNLDEADSQLDDAISSLESIIYG